MTVDAMQGWMLSHHRLSGISPARVCDRPSGLVDSSRPRSRQSREYLQKQQSKSLIYVCFVNLFISVIYLFIY
jgi:hypothetical protein